MSKAQAPRRYLGVRAVAPPDLQIATRNPTSSDTAYVRGQLWLNKSASTAFMWPGSGNWISLGSGTTGAIVTLTGGSGGALSPTAGNMNLLGTANQITSTGSGSTITFSIPSTFIAPGSIASTTSITAGNGLTVTLGNLVVSAGNISTTVGSISSATTVTAGTGITATTGNIVASAGNISATAGSVTAGTTVTATLGNITATNGNIVRGTAGNKDVYSSVATTTTAGANSAGTVTLVGGTATVATTAVTASSKIRLTRQGVGSTGANPLGLLAIGTITASTSFVINAWSSTDATALATTDVSSIFWEIVN